MTNSVNYKYVPGQSVYVINTLGPNGQYPYWGYPYAGCGYGYPYEGPIGYPSNYPNGFTSTTPAIQSGQVLQTRILFTNALLPATIMYDIRITNELGVTSFPESMVFPATLGVAGYQTVTFSPALTINTPIVSAVVGTATAYIDGAPVPVSINLATTSNIAAFIAAWNTVYGSQAVLSLSSGNLVVTSAVTGELSSIVIVDGTTPLFGSLPGFVSFATGVAGVASGLDQAQAYYATLTL